MRLIVVAAIALAGCLTSVDPWERNEFRQAERRWKSAGIQNYEYEMRTSCFCPPEITEWAVVQVRSNEVVGARSLDGNPLSGFALSSRKTVDQLFDQIRRSDDWIDDVSFDFDDELGYPLVINLEADGNVADAGVRYEARNLKPLVGTAP